jgi:hypothetical protein
MTKFLSLILFLGSLPNAFALAKPVATAKETKFIEAGFPKDLLALKNAQGKALSLANKGLHYSFAWLSLDLTKKPDDLVILYQATLSKTDTRCKLVGIDLSSTPKKSAREAILSSPDELNNCAEILVQDLDGNGTSEVLVTIKNSRGQKMGPRIFRWNGDQLMDITPEVNALRNLNITDVLVGETTLLVDGPNAAVNKDMQYHTYLMLGGSIVRQGSYDFFQILEKKSKQVSVAVPVKATVETPGLYTLELQNLTKKDPAITAEVSVFGSTVLKPQDLGTAPVMAEVNLKTVNDLKVKLSGAGNAKIQLTLMKKPL